MWGQLPRGRPASPPSPPDLAHPAAAHGRASPSRQLSRISAGPVQWAVPAAAWLGVSVVVLRTIFGRVRQFARCGGAPDLWPARGLTVTDLPYSTRQAAGCGGSGFF